MEEETATKKENISEGYVRSLVSGNIKRLRAMQGMSQIGLARAAGLTHNFINDIENCKKGISDKTLAKLSIVLNVEPHQLFLPDSMSNDTMQVFLDDFNDSLQKVVKEMTKHYSAKA